MTLTKEQFILKWKTLIELNHVHCENCGKMLPIDDETLCIWCHKRKN